MKLTVLVDNNTIIDRYFLGEPGLSFYIETGSDKILFDAGYSDAFLINSRKMDIDLLNINYTVISHGHLDHTWGLEPLVREMMEARLENRPCLTPEFICHPSIFDERFYGDIPIGMNLSEKFLSGLFKINTTLKPFRLNDRLLFLGEIPRINSFESNPVGQRKTSGGMVDDYIPDDSSLVYLSEKGLVIICGCTHSGICNTIEYAREVTGEERVLSVIGGLHLQNPSIDHIEGVKKYLSSVELNSLYPCHCTDLQSKIVLSSVASVYEVGSGMCLEF